MKQKLALCCALIHKPEVLFLDEPTQGLDPQNRASVWEYMKTLRAGGGITLVRPCFALDPTAAELRLDALQD